ncbi:MAG: hypothetical protein RIT27_679 [Pseudomonadota bacterium]|jgi:glycosyltransferase involved in cell wall biosynthesis
MALSYVLMTSARNESKYIEGVIKSVISQRILPKKWVIISDGSTDNTDAIIQQYAKQHSFIHYLRTEPTIDRNFASKVYALKIGLKLLENEEYDIIGNLDADITFEAHYFSEILKRFENDPQLGIVGGVAYEDHQGKIIPQDNAMEWNVAGANQNFRKACHEQIGGYRPLLRGGEDALADLMARMHGWKVQSFPELHLMHHRHAGTEKGHVLKSRYGLGKLDYSFGYHPLFEIAKCIFRIKEKPYFTGSAARFLGYFVSMVKREPLAIPKEVAAFLRTEQLQRLKNTFRGK